MIEVLDIQEKADGSAVLTLELTADERDYLVEYAVIDILKKRCEEESDELDLENMSIFSDYEMGFEESEKYTGP